MLCEAREQARRTISTTATYTKTSPQNGSTDGHRQSDRAELFTRQGGGDGKEVVTITTKTVEEYQGVKKK